MIRGLYTAASGMMATMIANDTMANNLANINTTGFKRNEAIFQSFNGMLIQRMNKEGSQAIGNISSGSKISETRINFNQGDITQTGNMLDMSIEGKGFFTIEGRADQKTYYTRAGNFTIDPEGFLTTQNGDYVMGHLGKIQMKLDNGPYSINGQGLISSNNKTGQGAGQSQRIDQLKITRFENQEYLSKVGDARFEANDVTKELPEIKSGETLDYTIHQETLERSNSNVIGELINSITGLRLYESLQKNIHLQNEALGKAVNDVGRFR